MPAQQHPPLNILSSRRLDQHQGVVNYLTGKRVGLETGLPDFDRQLRGLQGLVCVMGEPKVNKSTVVMQWALHHAATVGPAYYLDCENGLPLLTKRVLCNQHGMSEEALRQLGGPKVESLLGEFVRDIPFYACDEPLDTTSFELEITELMQAGKPAMVIIDSIQWLSSKATEKRFKIEEWVARLDVLKLKYRPNLTIVCISEKNRPSYKMATMSGAKESGSIEYKAEQLFDMQLDEDSGNVILQCVANRHGPRGARVMLEKVLQDPTNRHSFTFTMRETADTYVELEI